MDRNLILVADDSAVSRRMLDSALSGEGYQVCTVRDGFEAMAWIRNNPPADLVITDLHMPEMDGAGLIRQIRADGAYHRRPIFVLTAGGDEQDKQRVRDAGATAWILKPFDLGKLVAAINKVMGHTGTLHGAHS